MLNDLWLHITNVNNKATQYFTALFSTHKHAGYVRYIPLRKECEACPHYQDKERDYLVEEESADGNG